MLQPDKIARIEALVDYHDIFARYRMDIGMNEEFRIELTPNDYSPSYRQSLLTPKNFKGEHYSTGKGS